MADDEQVAENLKALLETIQYRIYVENVKPPASWEDMYEARNAMEKAFFRFMPDSEVARMVQRLDT